MRLFSCFLLGTLLIVVFGPKESQSAEAIPTWADLQNKRESLKSFHQEFALTRTSRNSQHTQSSETTVVVDGAAGRWRVRSISGAGEQVKVFDGKDEFEFEDGGNEYIRVKYSTKEGLPQPGVYNATNFDLAKAVETGRRPCGLKSVEHECVTIEIPLKPSARNDVRQSLQMTNGSARVFVDTVNGLVLSSRIVQNIGDGHNVYQLDISYLIKGMSYNGDPNESLFRLPANVTEEVKELSRWNAEKIRKQLAGKPAPEFSLTDMQGKKISNADLKGKTVLLDFWTTWCGPCRADGPSLDRLYQKYGGASFAIVGVSVDEDRSVVKKFLDEHPHSYPIALTTENQLPGAFRIGVFPTYVIIDSDGNIAASTDGDKGFSDLRRMLKKAGLDTN